MRKNPKFCRIRHPQKNERFLIYKRRLINPKLIFNGTSISLAIVLKNGIKKTIGVILPTENTLTFKT
jgi:hypothetical protein